MTTTAKEEGQVPTPKVESFPVGWTATPKAGHSETVATVSQISDEGTALPVVSVQAEATEQLSPQKEPLLDSASQYLLSVFNYWTARQQELMVCQHDLKSRICAQQLEISRIEVRPRFC